MQYHPPPPPVPEEGVPRAWVPTVQVFCDIGAVTGEPWALASGLPNTDCHLVNWAVVN